MQEVRVIKRDTQKSKLNIIIRRRETKRGHPVLAFSVGANEIAVAVSVKNVVRQAWEKVMLDLQIEAASEEAGDFTLHETRL